VAPLTVTLEGFGTPAPDRVIASYAWEIAGQTAQGRELSYTFDQPGNQTAVLTVTDDAGVSATASVQITVLDATLQPPSGAIPPSAAFTIATSGAQAPVDVQVDAAASSDPDGQIVAYAWDFGDGSGATGVRANHTYTAAGRYQITLSTTDNDGLRSATSLAVDVAAAPEEPPPNAPPIASIAADRSSGETPFEVRFDASGSRDSDGEIVAFEWDFGDGGVGTGPVVHHTFQTASDFTVRLTVRDNQGANASTTTSIRALSVDPLFRALEEMPEGSWRRVNRNRFQDVWVPPAQRVNTPSFSEPSQVIHAWSSMAWDPNRRHLIFWGGGHANYSGNEVYRFDANSMLWERASLPSDMHAPLGDGQYFAVDGPHNAPTSSHTYDNQEFLPGIDRFITFGGAKFNSNQIFVLEDGVTRTGPYLWDPSRAGANVVGGTTGSQVNPAMFPEVVGGRMWENRDTIVTRGIGAVRPNGRFVNATTAYIQHQGRDAVLVTEDPDYGGRVFRYTINALGDPALDRWELMGAKYLSFSSFGAGAYDSGNNVFVRTAATPPDGYALVAWKLDAPGAENRPIIVRPEDPSQQLVLSEMHGMDYDSVRGVLVLWDGGGDVWYVEPPATFGASGWVARRAPTGASAQAPAQAEGSIPGYLGGVVPSRGILGKWKYARDYDVFFGAHSPIDGDIWVYKPVGWQPVR